jgi:hypothetical protein
MTALVVHVSVDVAKVTPGLEPPLTARERRFLRAVDRASAGAGRSGRSRRVAGGR